MREVIPAALDGERIDRVVSLMTGVSRAEASALVAAGKVTANGTAVTTRSHRVSEGDEVAVRYEPAPTPVAVRADDAVEVVVVHEDADLLVVDKQPGLVVHPGAGNETGTLVNGLLARFPELASVGDPARPGIVHRLDKDTSGLLVVARSPQAHEALSAMMAGHEVVRQYSALAWGELESPSGMIDAPIGRSRRDPTRMAVAAGGRDARTRYQVVARFTRPVEVTELTCTLETGRTHQIRVHLSAIGHPVVGDDRYGGVRESFVVPRIFLHAAVLELVHPLTGEPLAFRSPLPADLQAVLDRLA